jgi:hypothetical protein
MPEDERTARLRAFSYAVVERNMTFALADAFAAWFTRTGRHNYPNDMSAALEHWLSKVAQ